VTDGKVYLELQGGCRGCMGARMTMKNGIERLLKEKIPAVLEVIDATDHG
jgi:Fe/S biogenesis protein NfuA